MLFSTGVDRAWGFCCTQSRVRVAVVGVEGVNLRCKLTSLAVDLYDEVFVRYLGSYASTGTVE